MANDPADRLPDSLLTGPALLGLVGVTVYVTASPTSWLSLAVMALCVVATAVVLARLCGIMPVPPVRGTACPVPEGPPPAWLVTGAIAAAVLTAGAAAWTGPDRASDAHIARLWLASIALMLLAAWWRPPGNLAWRRPSWREVVPWIGMIAIAALPRLVMLDRFPTVLTGDEGSFMVRARMAQHGELPGFFAPGFLSNPNLYPAVAGWMAELAGSPPADYRLLSAVVGTLGVLATWRLGRYLLGPEAGMAGAVILAAMPLNLWFSRNALNNISDATVLAAALLFLVRAVTGGRRIDSVLAGVTLGLGAYGYFGGRVFPGILLVSLALLTAGRQVRPREALRIAGWMLAGLVVVATPLIMAFRAQPDEFSARLGSVSPFTLAALGDDPAGTVGLYLENARDVTLAPWISTPADYIGFFYREPPLLGWPVAILLVIGIAACAVRIVRDRDVPVLACLVAPAAMLLSGLALTFPVAAQRLVALTPLYALVAGLGLIVVARWVASLARPVELRLAGTVIAAALVAMAVTDVRWFASENRQIDTYGDYRTIMMWDIGWRVDHAPAGAGEAPSVLFAGPPFVFTGGFNSLVIQAPELAMQDLTESLGTAPAPPLSAGTMLVIVPERQGERCEAERLYPDATVAEARDRRGDLLYIALYPEPLRGWSVAETPAETTFAVVADSPCG